MSAAVVNVVGDVLSVGAGIVAGIVTANPLVGIGVAEAGIALTTGIATVDQAITDQNQTKANVGTFGTPSAPATPPGQAPITPANTPAKPSVDAKTEADIAAEKYQEQKTLLDSEQAKLGETVLGIRTQEVQSEGGIRASAAARGLKVEGSPLMQLLIQQQMGATAEQYTRAEGVASISAGQEAAQSAYDTSALSGKEQLQYAQQQVDTAWMTAFTDVLNTASNLTGKFWNPAASEGGGFSSPYTYGASSYSGIPGGEGANAFGGGFGFG